MGCHPSHWLYIIFFRWVETAGVSSRPQAGALLTRLSFSAHRCHVSGLISKRAAVSAALESLDMQKPQNSKKICMQMRTAHQLKFIPQKQMFEYVWKFRHGWIFRSLLALPLCDFVRRSQPQYSNCPTFSQKSVAHRAHFENWASSAERTLITCVSRTSPTSQHDLNTWRWSSTRFLSNFSTQMAPLRLTDWSSLWCPHVVAVHRRMVNHTISCGEDTKRQLKGWICPFWKSTPAEVCPTPYFSPQFSFFSFNLMNFRHNSVGKTVFRRWWFTLRTFCTPTWWITLKHIAAERRLTWECAHQLSSSRRDSTMDIRRNRILTWWCTRRNSDWSSHFWASIGIGCGAFLSFSF